MFPSLLPQFGSAFFSSKEGVSQGGDQILLSILCVYIYIYKYIYIYISDARMAVISAGTADNPRVRWIRVIKKCILIIYVWVPGG